MNKMSILRPALFFFVLAWVVGAAEHFATRADAQCCVVPTSEYTYEMGTDIYGYAPDTDFTQYVNPQQFNELIQEFVGANGVDSCWWSGSIYSPATSLAQSIGGPLSHTWMENTEGVWGPDIVGWSQTYINYYRSTGRANQGCYYVWYQGLEVVCSLLWPYTYNNQLTSAIYPTAVVNCRYDINNFSCSPPH